LAAAAMLAGCTMDVVDEPLEETDDAETALIDGVETVDPDEELLPGEEQDPQPNPWQPMLGKNADPQPNPWAPGTPGNPSSDNK
jgi:hypothetical protein